MDWIEQLEPVGLIAFAMLLGGTVGLERELAGKAAGLRTLMLVAGAAALFVSVGDLIASYARRVLTQPVADFHGELIRADPIRIIEAIVTGTSILGAGTIWRSATAADAVGGPDDCSVGPVRLGCRGRRGARAVRPGGGRDRARVADAAAPRLARAPHRPPLTGAQPGRKRSGSSCGGASTASRASGSPSRPADRRRRPR